MRAADDDGNLQFQAHVVDPTAGAAGFNNDQVDRMIAEQTAKVAFFRGRCGETVFLSS